MSKNGRCGTALAGKDGSWLECERDGKHWVHHDGSGDKFVRAPGGAFVKPTK